MTLERSPTSAPARIGILLKSLGIDEASFDRILEFVLSERLVAEMARLQEIPVLVGREDELRLFRDLLARRTGRSWSLDDARAILARVKADRVTHEREPIRPEDALLLRLSAPLVCVRCGKQPPEVMLHIDHIVPASKGGSSHRENLQYLCAACNLAKSNKREVVNPWLL